MENKETFQARLVPYFSPSEQLDIKLAYCLAKFGHRAQLRHEMVDGKPTRYFEHCRRVALNLMDGLKIMDRDMIIAALLHDSLEDTRDLSAELIEHSFGATPTRWIRKLSKLPKDGYVERLMDCYEWQVLAIKACDKKDNHGSLMIPENTLDFKKKQIKELKEKYFPIFDRLVEICPDQHKKNVSVLRDELRRMAERQTLLVELEDAKANF